MRGVKRYKLPVMGYVSQSCITYSVGNIVGNIIIILYAHRSLVGLRGNCFVKYINTESLCCTPETNVMCQLHVNKKRVNTLFKQAQSTSPSETWLKPVLGIHFYPLDPNNHHLSNVSCPQCSLSEIYIAPPLSPADHRVNSHQVQI